MQLNCGTDFHLMIFDLDVNGHHKVYINHLVNYWIDSNTRDTLTIVTSPSFFEDPVISDGLSKTFQDAHIQFIAIKPTEYDEWQSQSSILKSFKEWEIASNYARSLKVDHVIFMYIDHFQLPIACNYKNICSFSGIYFRPTFHYHTFEYYQSSIKDRLRSWRQKLLIRAVISNPNLKTIFCLDQFVVPVINQLLNQPKAVYLPDPIEVKKVDPQELSRLKSDLGLKGEQKVFLLFGLIGGRKGIYQILEALQTLPLEIARETIFLFVGGLSDLEKPKILSMIDEINNNSEVNIISRYEFVSNDLVHLYFDLADVILAVYQKHVGMSGILMQALAANKPVICSNYGLMGKMAMLYNMGLVIDASQSQNIQSGIVSILQHISNRPNTVLSEKSAKFLQESLPTNFSRILIECARRACTSY
jgi:glycosyltransferase involved in cell wall biosynthesis